MLFNAKWAKWTTVIPTTNVWYNGRSKTLRYPILNSFFFDSSLILWILLHFSISSMKSVLIVQRYITFLFPARKFSFWNLFFKKSSFLFSYLEHWYIFWMIPDSLKLLSLNLFHSDNMKLLSVIFHGFWQFQDIWNIVSFYFCIFIDFVSVDKKTWQSFYQFQEKSLDSSFKIFYWYQKCSGRIFLIPFQYLFLYTNLKSFILLLW